MKIACLSFTDSGSQIGEKLERLKVQGYQFSHYHNKKLDGGIKSCLPRIWDDVDGLVFISSTGMAIRLSQPYIKDKSIDPAVVVVDDMGRFSISLLSGHLGGANELAELIGEKLNSISVITTASDNRNIEAVDLFAKKNNYHLENLRSLTRISALMVNGKKIGFYSEDSKIIDYPNLKIIKDLDNIEADIEGLIMVSSSTIKPKNLPYALLRPKNLNIGMGCRKGVEGDRIIKAIEKSFEGLNLSTKSIKSMGTVEVKKEEEGIIQAAKYFNIPLKIFSLEEIGQVEERFDKSQFVKDTIGVYSVSEPSAYLLGGELILQKSKHNGITISIAKETI